MKSNLSSDARAVAKGLTAYFILSEKNSEFIDKFISCDTVSQ